MSVSAQIYGIEATWRIEFLRSVGLQLLGETTRLSVA